MSLFNQIAGIAATVAAPGNVNTDGNYVPNNTKDFCCLCGGKIPIEDFRGFYAHEGVANMKDGTQRFVYREVHLRCSREGKKTNQRPLW